MKKIKIILVILALSVFVLLPEMAFGAGSGLAGSDAFFHLVRFTDAAMQLKTGHFSYFQQFLTFGASGKIVNALYGPFAAYLMGALLWLANFHGLIFWSLYLILINFAGLASMYYLERSLGLTIKKALIIGLLYITTGGVTATVLSGMYALGYAVFPILASSAIRLLRDKSRPVKVWELVLGLTLLAQIHMLALLLGLATYGLAFLTYLLLRFREKNFASTLLQLLKAAALVLLLNFNIYGGYLEVTRSNPTLSMPFHFAELYWPAAISFTRLNFGNLSGFVALLLLVVYGLIIWKYRQQPAWVWFAVGLSLLFGFLAFSNLTLLPQLTLFQFSSRFLVVAYTFALALLGHVLTRHKNKTLQILTVLALVLTVGLYMAGTSYSAKNFKTALTLSTNKGVFATVADRKEVLTNPALLASSGLRSKLTQTPSGLTDYLPNFAPEARQKAYQTDEPALLLPYFYADIIQMTAFRGTDLVRTVTPQGLTMTWQSSSAQETRLPVIAYAHTQLTLNGKLLSADDFSRSAVGAPTVSAQKGANTLTVIYQPAWWFIAGSWLQLVGCASLVLYYFMRRRKNAHAQK